MSITSDSGIKLVGPLPQILRGIFIPLQFSCKRYIEKNQSSKYQTLCKIVSYITPMNHFIPGVTLKFINESSVNINMYTDNLVFKRLCFGLDYDCSQTLQPVLHFQIAKS